MSADLATRTRSEAAGGERRRLPEAGETIGERYVLERVIGEGAMGVVFAARHSVLGHQVAIKLLRQDTHDSNSTQRLLREARTTMSLQSEHVIRVMDVGLHDGSPFIVMEVLQGEDLSKVLTDRGTLPIPDAVDCVIQACAGLAEAHAAGIVHRDLKPANLFLTRRRGGGPLVKVLDFGISKVPEQHTQFEESLTQTIAVLGSPLYMSPEQLRSTKLVDRRTDIWSLGVILYRLLAFDPPFDGESFSDLCVGIASEAPQSLRARRSEVPEALEAVIFKCLKKDPAERFSNVGALANALAPFATELGRAAIPGILRSCGTLETTFSQQSAELALQSFRPKWPRRFAIGLVVIVVLVGGTLSAVRLLSPAPHIIGETPTDAPQAVPLATAPSDLSNTVSSAAVPPPKEVTITSPSPEPSALVGAGVKRNLTKKTKNSLPQPSPVVVVPPPPAPSSKYDPAIDDRH